MVEFVDELDWRLNPAFNLDLPFSAPIHSSVHGLILLRDGRGYGVRTLCNPLTREYITLPCPGRPSSKIPWEIYGFGVTRMSGQYKVVRIFSEKRQAPTHSNSSELECQVFTIGSGSWRRIANCIRSVHNLSNWLMTFCNGNLHWWTSEGALAPRQISCLDLETELFSTFSEPPCDDRRKTRYNMHLSVSNGCLCACNNWNMEIGIWVMKVYGDEKSWTKEFTIHKVSIFDYLEPLYPIKVFRNGDVLMLWKMDKPLYYSSSTKTIQEVDRFESNDSMLYQIRLYTPSFLSLRTFATENVSSF